jgi:hypothetical protein
MAQVKESELLSESNEIYEQKKQTAHHMNVIATETAKMQKVSKSLLNRMKDYYLYQGKGWVLNNPLDLDNNVEFRDKISPVFIKLLQIIEDLKATDCLDLIDPYLKALNSFGIKIYIDPGKQLISDKEEFINAIESMGIFQKQINALDSQIKNEKSIEAEEINLTSKQEFAKLVSFYNKKENGKDIDDQYGDIIANYELCETGYTKVYDGTLN